VAHGAALRVLSKNPYVADQVSANHHHADVTARERAIVEFAVKITKESATIETADFDELRRHGLDDSDIWDVGAVAAFFNLSNRMAFFFNDTATTEIYTVGRGQ